MTATLEHPAPTLAPPPRRPRRRVRPIVRAIDGVGVDEVLVLTGWTRRPTLEAATGRSRLRLPLADVGGRVADAARLWRDGAADMARGGRPPSVRFLGDATLCLGELPPGPVASVEADGGAYRGTGGTIRDALAQRPGTTRALIVEGPRAMAVPLAEVMPRLLPAAAEADVVLARDARGRYAGIALVRAGCLSAVPAVGFVDLKEQALPRIAERHNVRVIDLPWEDVSWPLRDLASYARALNAAATGRLWLAGRPPRAVAAGGEAPAGFHGVVIEPGAAVAASARLHATAVLSGGSVGPDAVLVGCLVAAGGVVRAGERAAGQIFAGGRKGARRWA